MHQDAGENEAARRDQGEAPAGLGVAAGRIEGHPAVERIGDQRTDDEAGERRRHRIDPAELDQPDQHAVMRDSRQPAGEHIGGELAELARIAAKRHPRFL